LASSFTKTRKPTKAKNKSIINYHKMKTHNYSILTLIAVLFLCLSCQSNSGGENADSNRELILQYHEVWNTGQVEKLNEILAPDFVCHYLTDIE
jgi:hypothetical protein